MHDRLSIHNFLFLHKRYVAGFFIYVVFAIFSAFPLTSPLFSYDFRTDLHNLNPEKKCHVASSFIFPVEKAIKRDIITTNIKLPK